MKTLTTMFISILSSAAFAGTGTGSVSCNNGDEVVALYTWFHSSADSYATATVFVTDFQGKYRQYRAEGNEALEPATIKTEDGMTITVKPDLQNSTCTIEIVNLP